MLMCYAFGGSININSCYWFGNFIVRLSIYLLTWRQSSSTLCMGGAKHLSSTIEFIYNQYQNFEYMVLEIFIEWSQNEEHV